MTDEQVTGEDIEIRAVLDTSALLSCAHGHVHVGELLIDIADEGAYMGLPTVALLARTPSCSATGRPERASAS